jgi:hemolysin D
MIRIVIADDQQSIRSALQSQLKPFADIEIVGIAENGRKAVEQTAQWQPDVLLLDLEMPVLDGLDAAHEIKERSPKVKILVFTAQNDPTCLLPALRAGAHGYLLKGTPAEDLANAIRSVQKGHFQIGPGILEPTSNAVTEKSVASVSALGDTVAIAPAETRLQKSMLNSSGLVKAESSALAKTQSAALTTFDRPVLLQQSPLWSRVIIWGIVGSTAAILAWAYVFKFDEAIPATGQLEPQGAVKEVQSPVVGVVKSILVKDGQRVKKGEVLLSLDPKGALSEVASLERVRLSLSQENAFYRQQMQQPSVSSRAPIPSSLISPQMAALAESRQALFAETQLYRAQVKGSGAGVALTPEQQMRLQSSLREENSRASSARLESEQLQKQLNQVLIQLASARKTLIVSQGLLNNIAPVVAAGGIPKVEQLKQEEAVQKAQAEVERLQQEDARLKLAISQANEKLDNTESLSKKDVLGTIAANEKQIAQINSQFAKVLVENEKQISEIDNKLNQAKMTLNYQKLAAPTDGIVFDLKPKAPGFVANTTEPILKIVPSDSLIAKVYITNRDIGFVRAGMPVDVRVDSFPFSEFGDIKGTLAWIGSDALPPTQVRNYYSFPATVKLKTQSLSTQQRRLSLQSGMSLSVNIKTRQRTVMSIFTDLFTGGMENLKNLR